MLFPERNVASEALSARVIAGGEGGAPRLRGEGEVGPGICDRQIWFGRSTTSPSHCFAMGPTLSPAARRRGTLSGEASPRHLPPPSYGGGGRSETFGDRLWGLPPPPRMTGEADDWRRDGRR